MAGWSHDLLPAPDSHREGILDGNDVRLSRIENIHIQPDNGAEAGEKMLSKEFYPAASQIAATLRDQLEAKTPNVLALDEIFARIDFACSEVTDHETLARGIALIANSAREVMKEEEKAIHWLSPCALYLVRKFSGYVYWQKLLASPCEPSTEIIAASRIGLIQMECTRLIELVGKLPAHYDFHVLADKSGYLSENIKFLLAEAFPWEKPMDLLDYMFIGADAFKGCADDPSISVRDFLDLKMALTFIRMDVKVCWLRGMQSDDIWPRYFSQFAYFHLLRIYDVEDFLDQWERLVEHCGQWCLGGLPFTTQACLEMLKSLHSHSYLSVDVALRAITRLERFAPHQHFLDSPQLAGWLFDNIARPLVHASHSKPCQSLENENEELHMLIVYTVQRCSQGQMEILLSELMWQDSRRTHRRWLALLGQTIVALDSIPPSRALFNLRFINCLCTCRISVNMDELCSELSHPNGNVRNYYSLVTAYVFHERLILDPSFKRNSRFPEDLSRLLDGMCSAGWSLLVEQKLVWILRLYSEWLKSQHGEHDILQLLRCCSCLAKLKVQANNEEALLSALPNNVEVPRAMLEKQSKSSPLLDCLKQMMKTVSRDFVINEGSLVLVFWKKILTMCSQKWTVELRTVQERDRTTLLSLLCQLRCGQEVHPVLEWLFYALLFIHNCPAIEELSKVKPGWNLVQQRLSSLYSTLKVDAPWLWPHFQWYDDLQDSKDCDEKGKRSIHHFFLVYNFPTVHFERIMSSLRSFNDYRTPHRPFGVSPVHMHSSCILAKWTELRRMLVLSRCICVSIHQRM